MIKILDVDKLFDGYISDYVYKNIGKIKPEEIENNIPVLYDKFGNESLKELDGKTPNTYYRQFTAVELIEALKEHLIKDVSVSDFLCEAITANKDSIKVIEKELSSDLDEQLTLYFMNMLSDMEVIPSKRYLEFVLYDYSEPIRELATELICKKAEEVKEQVLEAFKDASDEKKVYLTEILSNCSKDDRVFDILIAQFVLHKENLPLYAQYLSKYGDSRALPFLNTAIEDEKINYADFEELRFAIESLGGEYDKKRDFTNDKFYKKIRGDGKNPFKA